MPRKSPKRHHYLPQSYLSKFACEGFLWIHDRQSGQYRKQTPTNTAVQGGYYTVVDIEGHKNTVIEEMFARLDSDAATTISSIESEKQISTEQRLILSYFVAYQMVRVPSFEKKVNSLEEAKARRIGKMVFASEQKSKQIIEKLKRDKVLDESTMGGITPNEMVKFVHDDNRYKVHISRNVSLEVMAKEGKRIANLFSQMNWLLCISPKDSSFITCDNPVALVPPPTMANGTPYGVATKGVQKVMPLSNSVCLIILDKGDDIFLQPLTREQVRNLNIDIVSNSARFVIGGNEQHMRDVIARARLSLV